MPFPLYRQTAYFDCDDTLILHQPMGHNCDKCVGLRDSKVHLNDMIVNQIKVHSALGHAIVLWSMRGGWWAQEVGEFLFPGDTSGLIFLTKPSFLYDDLEPSEWLPPRTWLNPSRS